MYETKIGLKITFIIWPGSPSSLLFTCFVFRFISFTTTVLLCLKILVISPIFPLSSPAITWIVSPTLTCILCKTGRLFSLHSFRSHRLSCKSEEHVSKNVFCTRKSKQLHPMNTTQNSHGKKVNTWTFMLLTVSSLVELLLKIHEGDN